MNAWDIAEVYFWILDGAENAIKNYCREHGVSYEDVQEEIAALDARRRRRDEYGYRQSGE